MIPSSPNGGEPTPDRMTKNGVEADKIIRRGRTGQLDYVADDLTVEEPLEIRIGRRTLATTMRTPGHDEELAMGFLLSEAVIRSVQDVVEVKRPSSARNRQNIIAVQLAKGATVSLTSAQRWGTITSSCGICGKESIAAVR